ncbi:UbiA family prenyltransferase [Cellulomonas timonensis]|uniref:UbiA family prenyltransferase n=1 Tax=Cellulomonas timonensis TaxID=1689271 RepID=UPI000835EDC3|nr:UbiA family prenyltransferase [Cellulomonas timonensis]
MTVFATALCAGMGAAVGAWLTMAGAVLLGQLSVGWSNDWVDHARDLRVGRADKPLAVGSLRVDTVRAAALTALAACVPASWALGWQAGGLHLLAVASAWSYNVVLKRTAWSWAPFAVSFGLIPVFTALAVPGRAAPPWWAVAAGALLGVGAHLVNVVPDLEDDAATGVRGLPHRLGARASTVLAAVAMLVATGCLVLAPGRGLIGPPGAGLAAAVLLVLGCAATAVARPRSRLPFALAMAVAAVDVVLLVGVVGAQA